MAEEIAKNSYDKKQFVLLQTVFSMFLLSKIHAENTDPMTFLEKIFHSVKILSCSGSVLGWIVIICTNIYIITSLAKEVMFLVELVS